MIFFLRTNFLSDCQFGFRPNHSTDTALVNIVDKWLKNIDEGFLTSAVFIDLRKAFDTVIMLFFYINLNHMMYHLFH